MNLEANKVFFCSRVSRKIKICAKIVEKLDTEKERDSNRFLSHWKLPTQGHGIQ